MMGRIWAIIWLTMGSAWFIAESAYFHGQFDDSIYGRETFYIVGKIIILTVFAIPGTAMFLTGAVKLTREMRKRNPS